MAGRARTRRRWSEEEKRRIVAQTLIPAVSSDADFRKPAMDTAGWLHVDSADSHTRPAACK